MNETSQQASSQSEQRLDTLELKLMDLENTVQELNDVILRQYRDIERLQLQYIDVVNRLSSSSGGSGGSSASPSAADELPPHY